MAVNVKNRILVAELQLKEAHRDLLRAQLENQQLQNERLRLENAQLRAEFEAKQPRL